MNKLKGSIDKSLFSSLQLLLMLIGLLGLWGCGGGGDDDSDVIPVTEPPPDPDPMVETNGIEGGGFVTQFADSGDTLFVGTRQLDLSSPELDVTIDGLPAQTSDLQVGQQITFTGTTSDDGSNIVVTAIVQDDLVEGPIEAGSIDPATGRFSVLGQAVVVSDLTVFGAGISPSDLSGLNDGDFVEVSGQIDANGVVIASRIDIEDSTDEFELTGVISAVDLTAGTFVVGSLSVDFSGAELEDFTGDPAVGDLVEVEGTEFNGNVLIATEVELEDEDEFDGTEGNLAVIAGVITSVDDDMSFVVGGQLVATNAQTQFDDGSQADLQIGNFVEVEGSFQSDGSVLASEVDFEADGGADTDLELTGAITELDGAAQSLVVLGVSVQIDSSTILVSTDDTQIAFADLSTGQRIEVEGFEVPDSPGVLQAAILEIEDSDEQDSVTGPVSNIAEPTLTIFGVMVATDANTEFEDDQGQSAFFTNLSDGLLVEAEGQFSGDILTAEEIELEDSDDD